MPQPNDLSRSLVALDQNSTIIAVIEMSQSSWLVAGMLPGIERQPRKKLEPNPERLLGLLHRWQDEAHEHAAVYSTHQCVFEKGREPLPCAGALFRVLQLRSPASDLAGIACDGSWYLRSAMVDGRYRCADRCGRR